MLTSILNMQHNRRISEISDKKLQCIMAISSKINTFLLEKAMIMGMDVTAIDLCYCSILTSLILTHTIYSRI